AAAMPIPLAQPVAAPQDSLASVAALDAKQRRRKENKSRKWTLTLLGQRFALNQSLRVAKGLEQPQPRLCRGPQDFGLLLGSIDAQQLIIIRLRLRQTEPAAMG
ncbi:MAG: hypothetical protein ACK53V_25970, partial [Planctomycetota bacterium]